MDTFRSYIVAFALALCAALPARAASVLPLYLEDLAAQSTTVFQGQAIENRTVRDAATGLVVTYTTFEVTDVLKGTAGKTLEIKQIGGTLSGEAIQYKVLGVPTFTVGEEYFVFLAGVSSAGFSSPIGLSQGRFKVDTTSGAKRVSNGRLKEVDLDEFKQVVRSHLRAVAR